MALPITRDTGISRYLQLDAPHVKDFELVNDQNETPSDLLRKAKVLVIGAGGLGCEILKNLAMSGFNDIHVIDMDTIDISNLNRQFLFRKDDVGKPKAEVAAAFIKRRSPQVNITPHFKRIQEMSEDFYLSFTLIVCGLDSIEARRWINALICGLVEERGFEGFKPIVDGGTEGLRGNARVILPTVNACLDCGLDLYGKKTAYPICTIANTPRLPEHCIEWASVLEWPRVFPDKKLDGDSPDDINWVVEKASARAAEFNIGQISYSLAQGVVKNIIPAIASTNAIVAAVCTNEALKIVTTCNPLLDNYMFYSGLEGAYMFSFPYERNPDCLVCGKKEGALTLPATSTLEELITALKESPVFQLKAPTLTLGEAKLYFQNPRELEALTRPNLAKSIGSLFDSGSILTVTDPTLTTSLSVVVTFTPAKQ
ncbi:NEDD8 activating enzyme [Coemansia thaxteri]|uniref:NEDD8-activating enzyme E1 catalytic subunit n=1 Tax=Coemansia thaxteri TaxID=2663907 RepID=A0A9W8BQM9_9FUNG|nr:NEDD8 activating enzyme [Coemansia thaxteri]KAJ2008981.1 NEDD8 activating enzyme [Coemansia thaxteri]KAJ2485630.1 NEDD8 activating enzyme [Coemansia sp. RSA 2320]